MSEERNQGQFSVYQFFVDGECERVRSFVNADEAVRAFKHYTTSVGARIGTTVRVILTNGGDMINAEWEFGKGLTYPHPDK